MSERLVSTEGLGEPPRAFPWRTIALALALGFLAGVLGELIAGEWTLLQLRNADERERLDSALLPLSSLPGPWGFTRPVSLLASTAVCLGAGAAASAGVGRRRLRVAGTAGALLALVLLGRTLGAGYSEVGVSLWVLVPALLLAGGVCAHLSLRGPPPPDPRAMRRVVLAATALVLPGLAEAYAARVASPPLPGELEVRDGFEDWTRSFVLTEEHVSRVVLLPDGRYRLTLRDPVKSQLIAARRRVGVLQVFWGWPQRYQGYINAGSFDRRERLLLPSDGWRLFPLVLEPSEGPRVSSMEAPSDPSLSDRPERMRVGRADPPRGR